MYKEKIPPHEDHYEHVAEAGEGNKQPPHMMHFSDKNGRLINLYLCCFCTGLPDVSLSQHCENFHLVSGTKCPFFSQVSDPAARIKQLIAAQEENQCANDRL